MDKLKGYKTVLLNLIMALITILTVFNPELVLDKVAIADNIEQVYTGLVALWAAAGIGLRAVTDSPIFQKEEDS